MDNYIYEYTKENGLKENASFYDFWKKYNEHTNDIYYLGDDCEVALSVGELVNYNSEDMPFQYMGIIWMKSMPHKDIGLRDYHDVLEFIKNYKDIVTDYYRIEEIKQKINGSEK